MNDLVLFVVIVFGFLAIFDIVVIVIACRHTGKLNKVRDACTQSTMATVVSTVKDYPIWARGSFRCLPVLEFNVGGMMVKAVYPYGKLANFTEKVGLKDFHPDYDEGMQVQIAYDPTDPQRVYIPDDREPYKFWRGMIIASLGTSAFFIIVILGFIALVSM